MGKLAVIMLLVVLLTGLVSVSPSVGAVISSEEVKATAKLEPSGSIIHKGNIRLRFDLFLEPDALGYDIHHVQVPVIPPEGYPGKIDEEGKPANQPDYDRWLEGLPKVWQNNPFLCVFVYFPPKVTDSEIKTKEQEILRLAYDHWVKNNDVGTVHKTLSPILPKLPPIGETPEATNRLEEIIDQKSKFDYDPQLNLTFNIKTLFFAWANPDPITIGSAATDRSTTGGAGYTDVHYDDPADDTGTINSVEIWANTQLAACEVATFFVVAGNNLSSRDNETLGIVTHGSKQTFAGLDMDVETGDFLGMYWLTGTMERDNAGTGYWYLSGDQIPVVNTTFTWLANRTLSLYGTGETVGVSVPTVTTQAATDVGTTTATGNGNITNTGGENCDIRGIVWDLASHGDPGDTAPAASDYANDVAETNSFGTGAFTRSLTGLPSGTTIYARAYAHNTAGYAYGGEINFLTQSVPPPAIPSEILPEGRPAPIGIGHLAWFIPLVLFTVPAFWKRNALMFMLAAACSLMMGFYWYVIFTTNLGMSLGILLATFGLVCLIFALGCLFKRRRTSE